MHLTLRQVRALGKVAFHKIVVNDFQSRTICKAKSHISSA